MTVACVRAPAKLNFGLEILGRRSDGYHEIRTVLAMVDLLDVVKVRESASGRVQRLSDLAGIPETDDLALRALVRLRAMARVAEGAQIAIEKRIPVAAGLGGASSDAAAALLAARSIWRLSTSIGALTELAAQLGSDVPFFLGGPCAHASGRGTALDPLPPVSGYAVVVSPPIPLAEKTAVLYSALVPGDFSDGSAIALVTSEIRRGMLPPPEALRNAFSRPLYALVPELAAVPQVMHAAGAPFAALSGAGGSHYTLMRERGSAEAVAGRLGVSLPPSVSVVCAPLRTQGLRVEFRPER